MFPAITGSGMSDKTDKSGIALAAVDLAGLSDGYDASGTLGADSSGNPEVFQNQQQQGIEELNFRLDTLQDDLEDMKELMHQLLLLGGSSHEPRFHAHGKKNLRRNNSSRTLLKLTSKSVMNMRRPKPRWSKA